MQISPPFALEREDNETEVRYLERAMPNSDVTVPGTGVPEGSYPLSLKAGWHGGLHLQAPSVGNDLSPVAAIADGEIVYARSPTAENTDSSPKEPRNYNAYGNETAWTNDGCVIIKHKVKMGSSLPTKTDEVVFLSIYMHLSELRGAAKTAASKTMQEKQTVKRKDVIGLSGKRMGKGEQLHVEIVCDDENLRRLAGRNSGDGSTDVDGRKDLVFGQIYFQLPVGTKFYAEQPACNVITPTHSPVYTLEDARLYIGIDYCRGDAGENLRGQAIITTYQADGSVLGAPLSEPNGEYRLYQTALDIQKAYPATATVTTLQTNPEVRVIYELLRFGRVFGPKELSPSNLPHWRKVRCFIGEAWVNLNGAGVTKSSDADFPVWRGWKLIDDDENGDSRCDSEQLLRIVKTAGTSFQKKGQSWDDLSPNGQCKVDDNENGWLGNGQSSDLSMRTEPPSDMADISDGALNRSKLENRLKVHAVREALEKTICKLPSEWDKEGIEARWGWLRSDKEFGLNEQDFAEFSGHAGALAFLWNKEKFGLTSTHWHFHPRQFLKLFRSFCVWPDLIRRWQEAEDKHELPDDEGLDDFAKTALYEYGLRASVAAVRNHQNNQDFAPLNALDKNRNNKATIFGMRIHTDINSNDGRGLWDDRVVLLKRDKTGVMELLFRGRYTTEPSGRYLDGGVHEASSQGNNVGGSSHKDIGRLIANRSYEYTPFYRNNNAFGPARFGNNQFNILRKTTASQVERLVTIDPTLAPGAQVSESNAQWQTGAEAGYSEGQSMHFHKGYSTSNASSSGMYGMTGSAGCQTFPYSGDDTFDIFMSKLEPLNAGDRFQYVLISF